MSYKFNRKYYRSLDFYFGVFTIILWFISFLFPISSIDFLVSGAFLIYSVYALFSSLTIKKNKPKKNKIKIGVS